nr:MAG TPA: hypothetical protein [Caudoviricetes sp.]
MCYNVFGLLLLNEKPTKIIKEIDHAHCSHRL